MVEISNLQETFFKQIKGLLPDHLSLVDEISELLEISPDSAYRRLRGEKQLSLDELIILCSHYKISLDNLFNIRFNRVTFNLYALDEQTFVMKDYLGHILSDFERAGPEKIREMVIIFNELHFFQFIQVPEVAHFKMFFWCKSNLNFQGYRDRLFSFDEIDKELIEICRRISSLYCKTPTTEVLTSEALASFIRQILFIQGIRVLQVRQ
jgi:hypothetical protein